ncbi:MAG: hypothetical protein E6R03_12415 [Hyphomicrobiaceae bacterium]|nr:MAG: hypothetical protein E6R03_12415 [Hyphomicrobiaceae bacterium]
MTDPTALPSRERAAAIAKRDAADASKLDDYLRGCMQKPMDYVQASRDYERAKDTAAILAAYASGALVPAGEVTAMRERAAAICDDEAGEKPSPYYETSRAQEALEAAAARIRALPLEVPHDR